MSKFVIEINLKNRYFESMKNFLDISQRENFFELERLFCFKEFFRKIFQRVKVQICN